MNNIKRNSVFVLAIFLSVWLIVWSAKSIPENSQTELFLEKSTISLPGINTSLPKPGTYTLQKIFPVPNLSVLDTKGHLQPITKYAKGKLTLLTFFYERCSDVNGCPYAMNVFHIVKSKLQRNEKFRDSIRFVHISFDPERDTPIMMAGLEKRYSGQEKNEKGIEWNFLTTPSVNELLPLVDAFGQNVDVNINPVKNTKDISYSHVLKVFLIDQQGFVREIYSTSYLSVDMLINDIKTLALESKG